jgi:hypothetical protein
MAAEHIVKSYDEELNRLNKMIVEMGGLAESQFAAAIDAVTRRDSELAARVTVTTRSVSSNAAWIIWQSGSSPCAGRWRAICARSLSRLRLAATLNGSTITPPMLPSARSP